MAKLGVELIPKTCYYSNVRSLLPTSEWDRLRKLSYAHAEYKCEICGGNGLDQGYKHPLECHEIWSYNDRTKVQTLDGLVSLCPWCHLCKHIGRANVMGYQAIAFQHMENVNDWDHKKVVTHIAQEFEIFKERSKHEWVIDLTILSEQFGVDEKVIIKDFIEPLRTKVNNIENFELIFIDNNSSDKTFEIIHNYKSEFKYFKLIKLSNYFGKEAAILAGLDACEGEAAIIMDPDLEDPIELIDKLINKLYEGYDVVLTVRKSEQIPVIKKFFKKIFYMIMILSSEKEKLQINSGDFRIINKKVIKNIISMRERTRFLRGLVNFVGYKQTYLEFDRPFRNKGETKSSINFLINYALDSLFSFSSVPIRLILRFGIFLFIFLFVFGIYLLIQKLFSKPIEGFTSVLLLIGLSTVFNIIAIGIVGEYVSRIYNEVKNRPNYIVDKIITNNDKTKDIKVN